jgi:hypothetical protein
MTVLECVKPGAKPGQVILSVDLTTSGNYDHTIATLKAMGYAPAIRHVTYKSGVHVLAIVRDETHKEEIADEYLIDEWLKLQTVFSSDAVRLWRGSNK